MANYKGYQDFPLLPELYDLIPTYVNRPDRDFYLDYCCNSDGKILELGCGTGRILIPAAEAGGQITGLDQSDYMLSRCREKLQHTPRDVQNRVLLVQGDMSDFRLDDSFQLTIIPFHAFQHLISVNQQLACLRKVNHQLEMNGKLILDVFKVNIERMVDSAGTEEIEDMAEFELPDGRRLRRTHRIIKFRRAEQYNDVELIYYLTEADGTTRRIVQAFPFRYFFRYEMEHLLARCGFKIVDIYGDCAKSSFTDDSPEMFFVAMKTREID